MNMENSARTGEKGTVRREKKKAVVHNKRLQSTLKRVGFDSIPAIDEVNIFKDDVVIHFIHPEVQVSLAANTWVVSGTPQTKKLIDILPQIIGQLGIDNLDSLKKIAEQIRDPTGPGVDSLVKMMLAIDAYCRGASKSVMNMEKLMKMENTARTGEKRRVRREKKAVHKTTTTDDKRLQSTLKRVGVDSIPAIDEVNIFKDDVVIQFIHPEVQVSLAANTWVVSGTPQTKKLKDILPQIIDQLGIENLDSLKKIAEQFPKSTPGVDSFVKKVNAIQAYCTGVSKSVV